MKEVVKLRILVLMLSLFAVSGTAGGLMGLQKPTFLSTHIDSRNKVQTITPAQETKTSAQVLGENDAPSPSVTTKITPKLLISPSLTSTPLPTITASIKKVAGDVNGDGRVDLTDATLWIAQYRGDLKATTADLNADKKIDLADFELIRQGIIAAPKVLPTVNLGPCDSKGEVECLSSSVCKAIYSEGNSDQKFLRCVRGTSN